MLGLTPVAPSAPTPPSWPAGRGSGDCASPQSPPSSWTELTPRCCRKFAWKKLVWKCPKYKFNITLRSQLSLHYWLLGSSSYCWMQGAQSVWPHHLLSSSCSRNLTLFWSQMADLSSFPRMWWTGCSPRVFSLPESQHMGHEGCVVSSNILNEGIEKDIKRS